MLCFTSLQILIFNYVRKYVHCYTFKLWDKWARQNKYDGKIVSTIAWFIFSANNAKKNSVTLQTLILGNDHIFKAVKNSQCSS